ncbi:uncharacterized protein LOC126669673 [Mercurialis annua]|uniref:uncharacterized protein LOC126669673 n=1 Tax=Mercurialis annua TaxID=3986 RepID=UPI00216037AE|nr:uncharacterized protein LOC126669673 [Mercurialis annua]
MGFKLKNMAWVGDICQKFETIYQEVDDIVSQVPVKFVENQVHTVGRGMKKLCSEVVHVVDPVRCEAQAVALKGNAAVGDYIKLMIGIKDDHGHTASEKQPLMEPNDDFSVNNSESSKEYSERDLLSSPATPTSEEPHEGEISDLALRKNDDVSINGESDLNMEELVIKDKFNAPEALESLCPQENKLVDETLVSEFIGSLDEVSQFTSVDGEELCSPQKVRSVCHSPANDSESMSESLRAELFDSKNENARVSVGKTSPSTSFNGEELEFPEKVITLFHSNACVSDAMSNVSSAVALSELGLSAASSCGSIFTEPRTLHENSFNHILKEVVSDGDPVIINALDSDNSNWLVPSTSYPINYSYKEVAETSLSYSVLSLESTGCSNETSFVCDGFECSGMETVDLSDEVKLEKSCAMVADSTLYEASRRIHNFRSLKKKLQGVFNSKKRLSKEYEQLAIWFGDSDTDSRKDTAESRFPSSRTICIDTESEIQDSEWELL